MGPEPASAKVEATLLMLLRFLSEPLFTSLRTRQQLGYIVSVSIDSFGE
jgi:secreted Zn-dependent insulinase-like peptidase